MVRAGCAAQEKNLCFEAAPSQGALHSHLFMYVSNYVFKSRVGYVFTSRVDKDIINKFRAAEYSAVLDRGKTVLEVATVLPRLPEHVAVISLDRQTKGVKPTASRL